MVSCDFSVLGAVTAVTRIVCNLLQAVTLNKANDQGRCFMTRSLNEVGCTAVVLIHLLRKADST